MRLINILSDGNNLNHDVQLVDYHKNSYDYQ